MNQQSKRTVHFAMFLACLMVAAGLAISNAEVAMYVIGGLAFLSIPPAMRHSVGDLAGGGGMKGAWKVLTTDAKPDAGPPSAAPGGTP
jgi:hypothetical protein